MMVSIRFYFEQSAKEVIIKKVKTGQTVLESALKNNIDIDHNCGGICSCSTCHVYVVKGNHLLEAKSRKEQHYIDRLINKNEQSRLSCQCLIIEENGEMEIVIPAKV